MNAHVPDPHNHSAHRRSRCLFQLASAPAHRGGIREPLPRKQLALYQERGIKPSRLDPATRITMVVLSECFNWRQGLMIVRPESLIRWQRAGFRLFWRWKPRPGRPAIPLEFSHRGYRDLQVYVLVVIELGTRKLVHVNVTAHPTASGYVCISCWVLI